MSEDRKTCSVCQVLKPLLDFNKRKTSKDGHRSECKCCQRQAKKKYFEENKEVYLAKAKLPENRAKLYAWIKDKYNNDPEWRERKLAGNRNRNSSAEYRAKRREWYSIPNNKIACNMRVRLRAALKGKTKSNRSLELLGASVDFVKEYLESKFEEGMTWDNHGEWHIDHIIPCNFFDFSKEEHQRICFNYRNLQPMWAKENHSKSDNITIDNVAEFIEEIRLAIL